MHRINVATGALLSTEAVPPNGDCSFDESGTACAFHCSCTVTLARCDSGKPIAAFEKTYVEMFGGPGNEEPHAGCYGSGVGLIGGGAGISVLEIEDKTSQVRSTFSRPHVIVGVDSTTGLERWRSSALAGFMSGGSGVVGDRAYRAGHDGELDLFDVKDGHVLFHHGSAHVDGVVPRRLVMGDAAHSQLLYTYEQEAALLDTTRGTAVWRKTLPADSWGILEGSTIPSYRIDANDKPRSLLFLDRRTGAERGRVALPPRSSVLPASESNPASGFYVHGKELGAFDANGTERAHLAALSPPSVRVGADWVSLFSNEEIALLDGRDLHRVARLAGSYAVQPGSSLGSQVLLYRYIEKGTKPGEAIVLSR